MNPASPAPAARRVVVKLGTAVVTRQDGGVALSRCYAFVEALAALRHAGREVLVVTSGAVGLGRARLGLDRGPRPLKLKQACAAVGQGRLMALYGDAFDRLGVTTAQVLLTEEDFSDRRRYLTLRGTMRKLLELGVIPIINENDTVSTAELEPVGRDGPRRVNFGDNDRLSALVASKIEADLLVILTDVEGLFTRDPSGPDEARLIPVVDRITPALETVAGGPHAGRGGMRTKLEAARIATRSGCATIVANGLLPGVIERLFAGEALGTLFLPQPGLSGKRRWIAFATSVRAGLVVTAGAHRALLGGKASLLPAGVIEVRGAFRRGDVVSVFDQSGREFARGIVNCASATARRMSGLRSDQIAARLGGAGGRALIRRDNLALLEPGEDAAVR